MGLTWDRQKIGKSLKELERPYQLYLRQIAVAGGVSHTSLRNKEGENPREGEIRPSKIGRMPHHYPALDCYTSSKMRVILYVQKKDNHGQEIAHCAGHS